MSPEFEEARRAANRADSYSRLSVVMAWEGRLPRLAWFELLGEQWTCCDAIAPWRSELRHILREASAEELAAMMDEKERAALAALPHRITVYRGCYPINRSGLSWSTDRAVAAKFPTLMRYCRPNDRPLLREGIVQRDRVVLKLDRREQEIIAHHVRIVAEKELPAPG